MRKVISIILIITLTISMYSGVLYADEVVFEGDWTIEENVFEEETVFEDPSSWNDDEYVTNDPNVFDEEYVSEDSNLSEEIEYVWDDQDEEEIGSEDVVLTYNYENPINEESSISDDEIINEDTMTEEPVFENVVTSGTCGKNLTWNLTGGYDSMTLSISGSGLMDNYDCYTDQYDNSRVDPPWFNYSYFIKKIIISQGVSSIGDYAFYVCGLTEITIPNSIIRIGKNAFNNCQEMTSIIIPNSVTSIDSDAFYCCLSLSSITIPDSVTSISDFAFCNCESLTSITIPNSVTSIGSGAFSNCKRLTSITIPDSVTSIGSFVFEYCKSLTSITIPDSVTSIGGNVFQYCKSLTSITIPDGLTSLDYYLFLECTGLTSIDIPNGVTSIWYAFTGCTNLTSIKIPDSVTSISDNEFSSCDNLTIYGSRGSYAESYAKDHNIKFVELKENRITIEEHGDAILGEPIHIRATFIGSSSPTDISWRSEKELCSFSNRSIEPPAITGKADTWWISTMATFTGTGTDVIYVSASGLSAKSSITIKDGTIPETTLEISKPAEQYETNKTVQEKIDTTNEKEIIGKYQEISNEIDKYFSIIKNKATNETKGLSYVDEMKKYDESVKTPTLSHACTDERIIEAAYYGLSLFYKEVELQEPFLKNINLGETIEKIGSNIINDVASQYWKFSKKVVYKQKYNVDINITGFSKSLVGNINVNGNAFVVSDSKQAWNTMAQYLVVLDDKLEETVKNGLKYYINEMNSILDISSFAKEKYKEVLSRIYDYLKMKGLGNLQKYAMYFYDIKTAYSDMKISLGNNKSIKKIFSDANKLYDTVKNYNFSDNTIKDRYVAVTLEKIQKLSKELDLMLYNYIYHSDEDLEKERNFLDNIVDFFGGKKIKAECPVDLYIYNENGKQIGFATQGNCSYEDNIYIHVENDIKTILVPGNLNISIKAVSTGAGSMKYTIEEYDDEGKASIIKYNEIPLSIGTNYIQKINGGKIDQNAIPAVINVKNNDYIVAKEYVELVRETKYTISCAVEGKGNVIGSGSFGENEDASLLAMAEEGFEFEGWYENGVLLGRDNVLILKDKNNHVVTARFVESPFISEFESDYELDNELGIKVDSTAFPDPDFRNYVTKKIDLDKDGYLSTNEVNTVTRIDFYGEDSAPDSIEGIGIFKNLESLDCNGGGLEILDLENNSKLTYINCADNELKHINISSCENLQTLLCYMNHIETLDLKNNKKLKKVDCSVNYLSDLNIDNNENLEVLICDSNEIKKLDIRKCPVLIKKYEACSSDLKYDDNVDVIAYSIPINITLNKSSLSIYHGESVTLKATVTGPSNTVTWTSSDKSIATVKNGKVTGVKPGSAIITAEANGKKASCKVTVKKMKVVDSGKCGKNLTWKLTGTDGNMTLTISGSGEMDAFPYGSPWSGYKGSITAIIISDRVTSIGHSAFFKCTRLTNITIPNSVTNIEASAFNSCRNLISITIPNGVRSISNSAFMYCSSLANVKISNSVTNIEGWAFQYCTNLTSITIPNSVTSIGEYAFYECTGLKNIKIPNSVTSIGFLAFGNCTSLKSITIPNNVTSIGEYVFSDCTSLTSIIIPYGVTSIGDRAFNYCTSLTSITIPYSVKSIDSDAFYDCKNLKIYSYSGSYAEKYAKENNIPFRSLGSMPSITASDLSLNKTSLTLYTPGAAKSTFFTLKASTKKGKITSVSFKSSNTSVAMVNKTSGKVTSKKAGTATITATIKAKNGSDAVTVKLTCKVTVKKPTLTVTPTSVTLKKGKTKTLTVKTTPSATVTYASSNKKIAIVSSKGKITAKKKGSCKITVKCNGITKTVKVTVK